MLCSELEKSPLSLPSSSQIKSFRKIMEMSDCIQVTAKNHNDMIQFFSKCIQAVLHTLNLAQEQPLKNQKQIITNVCNN